MNPLITPTVSIPFSQIDASQIEPAVREHLAVAQAAVAAIESADPASEPTWENTLGALEKAGEGLEFAMAIAGHLESTMTSDAVRAAYAAVQEPVASFSSALAMNAKVYARVKAFAGTPAGQALVGAQKRHLEKTLLAFRRDGAELPPAEKERVAAIDLELAKTTLQFSQNVVDSTNAFSLSISDETKLAGLPDRAKEAAREAAKARGQEGWLFTLQAPSAGPVLSYLDDASIRETIWRAYNTRATSAERDNQPLMARIVELRAEKARLLGFATFADYILSDRMAKTGTRALAFVTDLAERVRPAFVREQEELLAYRKSVEPTATKLDPWDVGYWAEKQRKALYDFDEEVLRPYLPLPAVEAGLFAIVERLYGITVRRADAQNTWHESVVQYELFSGNNEPFATVYTDWFPRASKRDGAWMQGITERLPGSYATRAVGLVAGNMTPPSAGKPACLSFREVQTIFHEFGHLLHHVCSEVPVRSLAGARVAWDFVELPSQIFENWIWEREALALFARHVDTGEEIPAELFEKMVKARNFRAASMVTRQLGFSTTDLLLHTSYTPADGDIVAWARKAMAPFATTPLPEDYAMIASFNHLFADAVGYAAAYYSYGWAEALDADAFSLFKERGIFDRATGEAFRTTILAKGDSEDPADLFRSFRGRDPNPAAMLARLGLG